MKTRLRARFTAVVALGLFAGAQAVSAQLEQLPYQLRYNSGQSVQPYFEGWWKNPDGSFNMQFGYLNRNYVEEVSVPVGPQNNMEPGGPDRGQPGHFFPRRNPKAFGVTVPKDFGKKELVWTITFRGRALKAIGWLQPEWEIPAPGVGRDGSAPVNDGNQPPTLTLEPVQRVVLPATLTLTASFADDGLPKPAAGRGAGAGRGGAGAGRGRAPVGQETPPILMPTEATVEAPANVPAVRLNLRGGRIGGPRAPAGASVSYIVWRGPAAVKTEPIFATITDGKAVTTATFTQPGEYVLRAHATDGQLSTDQDVKVAVVAASAPQK